MRISLDLKTILFFVSLIIMSTLLSKCSYSLKLQSPDKPLFQPFSGNCDKGYYDAVGMNIACIPDTWIVKKISFDVLKSEYFTEKNRKRWLRHPEQYNNKFWLEVESLINEDGKLLLFDSPKEYWENLAGRSGWAIEINGKIAFVHVVAVS